jgi:hypothetical protein
MSITFAECSISSNKFFAELNLVMRVCFAGVGSVVDAKSQILRRNCARSVVEETQRDRRKGPAALGEGYKWTRQAAQPRK